MTWGIADDINELRARIAREMQRLPHPNLFPRGQAESQASAGNAKGSAQGSAQGQPQAGAQPGGSRALVPIAPPKRQRSDNEFLPAALEIIDTPSSPVQIAMLKLICGAFAVALLWSYFGWIDIHAIAQGKIQPSGRSKVVQSFEPGKVAAIYVEDGARVKAGDVLMELDPTETTADRRALARDLEAIEAEIARRKTGIAAARSGSTDPVIPTLPGGDAGVAAREADVLAADLANLSSTRESIRAQIAEKAAEKKRIEMSIAARQRLHAILTERVEMRDKLRAKEFASRAAVIDALQEVERENTSLAGEKGRAQETEAAIVSLNRKLDQVTSSFIADQTQKLADAERKRDRIAQELIKAQSKSERTKLKAPIDGFIQQLAVTTIGQVVSSGQSLMTVVPQDGAIEIEAMILNQDIGFVEPGQTASVKVEAFPYTRYGAIDGTVVKVSRDAVDERMAASLSDPASAAAGKAQASPQQKSQNLVFPATLTLRQTTMNIDGKLVPLSPGMAVTVEVKTGSRRVIDYVMSPLREVAARAGHER